MTTIEKNEFIYCENLPHSLYGNGFKNVMTPTDAHAESPEKKKVIVVYNNRHKNQQPDSMTIALICCVINVTQLKKSIKRLHLVSMNGLFAHEKMLSLGKETITS